MKDLVAKNARSLGLAARLVSAAIITGFLYYGRVVLIPLALALLIAFALHPVVRRLIAWRLPRGLSVGIVVTLLIVVLGGLSWFIGGQITSFAGDLPSYRSNIVEKVRDARHVLSGGVLDKVKTVVNDAAAQTDNGSRMVPATGESSQASTGKPATVTKETTVSEWLQSIGAVTDPITTFGLVILLVTMLLIQWTELRARFLGMIAGNVTHTTNALADASRRMGHFLFLQLVYNSAFGLIVGLGLWVLGVPYAALWGLCAALFRYVPYAGPLFAMLLPMAVSLVTSSGWTQVTSVGVMFLILELASNNFIEPWLYGSKLGVSEIGIVMASVAWTYLWGAAGLLLATPLTVCLVVLGKHVPCLGFFAKLLGNDEVLSGPEQYYQRLLAGDSLEATELAEKIIKDTGRQAFVTDTLLPALAHARRDQLAGWLSRDNLQGIMDEVEAVGELLANEDDRTRRIDHAASGAGSILLWSTCPLMDAVLPILREELRLNDAGIVKSSDLTGDIIQELLHREVKPRAISLLHLSEVDSARAFAVLKRLKQSLPDIHVQIGRLGEAPFSDKERSTFAAASSHAATIAEARAWASTYSTAGAA